MAVTDTNAELGRRVSEDAKRYVLGAAQDAAVARGERLHDGRRCAQDVDDDAHLPGHRLAGRERDVNQHPATLLSWLRPPAQ